MKILKYNLFKIAFLALVVVADLFFLEPFVKEKYLAFDLANFDHYWKCFLITFAIIYISLIFYKTIIAKDSRMILASSIFFILPSFLLAFFFQDLTENLILSLNVNYEKAAFQKEYTIQRYEHNKVFQLYDNDNEIIADKDELDRIEELRKSNHLSSPYDLKNGDTINLSFAKGYLDIKYLK